MKYYANYKFERKTGTKTVYLLKGKQGEVSGLKLAVYKVGELKGCEYIQYEEPREESIKKYFSHVFTGENHLPITSTESLDSKYRTFGDTKKLGTRDLILIQFSKDMNRLEMWFVADKGNNKAEKQETFRWWCSYLDQN